MGPDNIAILHVFGSRILAVAGNSEPRQIGRSNMHNMIFFTNMIQNRQERTSLVENTVIDREELKLQFSQQE